MTDPALMHLIDQIHHARLRCAQLQIRGGGTKAFYGEPPTGVLLDVTSLAGISSYDPTELVVSARAGTPLAELEAILLARGQCLPFEPPRFSAGTTVGGMVAARTVWPSARQRWLGARSFIGPDAVERTGRSTDLRRPGCEECGGLRRVAAHGGVLGNSGA